jgi:hypothetical protein
MSKHAQYQEASTLVEGALAIWCKPNIFRRPDARSLLRNLISEIRIRTYSLPNTPRRYGKRRVFSIRKKNQEANAVLLTALSALVETNQVHGNQDGQALRAHWA